MQIAASPGTTLNLTRHDGHRKAEHVADEPIRAAVPALIDVAAQYRPLPPSPRTRPVAALLAQLVAAAEDLPATRALRREDSLIGTQAYLLIAGLRPETPPRGMRIV